MFSVKVLKTPESVKEDVNDFLSFRERRNVHERPKAAHYKRRQKRFKELNKILAG